MSVATVVTLGFGSFGSVNLLPTLGYSIPTVGLHLRVVAAAVYRPGLMKGEPHGPGARAIAAYRAGGMNAELHEPGARQTSLYRPGAGATE